MGLRDERAADSEEALLALQEQFLRGTNMTHIESNLQPPVVAAAATLLPRPHHAQRPPSVAKKDAQDAQAEPPSDGTCAHSEGHHHAMHEDAAPIGAAPKESAQTLARILRELAVSPLRLKAQASGPNEGNKRRLGVSPDGNRSQTSPVGMIAWRGGPCGGATYTMHAGRIGVDHTV